LAHDLGGPEIKIGLLAPLSGPRRAEGELLLRAAELALEDEAAVPLPHGCRIGLAKRDESGPWGQAASEVVRLVEEDRAIALITSSDGVAAHLAEQVSTKLGVPVITLSTDTTTTQINLPWIFRLGPADLDQARAFARNIYLQRCLKRVVVVTQLDHDGRVGAEAFKMVAKELSPETAPATVLVRVAANDTPLDANSVVQEILTQKPQALVFWTSSQAASELLGQMRLPSIPIYLCQKAAAGPSGARPRPDHEETGGIWTVSTEVGASVPPLRDRPTSVRAHFEQRYRERTGNVPSVAAAQAYDAVRIIAAALRNAGPNRARLRDALAETRNFPGASGPITFDHAGNDLSTVTLVPRD
jgi:branched-chain amino acid transport system substrate-binding protein